jgi:hypothetical protein
MKNLLWQVCTPDQAEKLKKLGITQSQSCYYFQHGQLQYVPQHFKVEAPDACAAFTSTELGIMLPYYYQTARVEAGNVLERTKFDLWTCRNVSDPKDMQEIVGIQAAPTEATTRAGMIIHLLCTYLVKVEDLNSRLEAAVAA